MVRESDSDREETTRRRRKRIRQSCFDSRIKSNAPKYRLLERYVARNVNDKKQRQVPSSMRFEAFLDPMNNWVVWDHHEQYFAEVGTRYLQSLPEERAKAFCTMLNILLSKDDAAEPTSVPA